MLVREKKPDTKLVKLTCWCTAIINGAEAKVRVRHVSRGKFLVIEAERDTDAKFIDASDIVHCDA